jgi:class 3 adenylate cyclase
MADLPSGAVTFLFTDIEGSTRLVRQLRGRYADLLSEHQRLLREAFSQHDGYEIDTQGDAFFYAFGSAHEAVLAAVEAQRALSGYPWPEDGEVKVRIGIHTGQAAPVNGRYTGLAVHRAARICAAGHGGQVLVSQATQSLLEDEEEDLAVRMRDLGDQRLKDIERPVRLYQVAAPGLATDFPPPRGEAPPTDALEATMVRPVWHRKPVIVAAGLALLALLAAGVWLATRETKSGLSGVLPNHVGIIDPETNEIVDEIQVGLRPGPVAVVDGAVWIGNLDERTLTKIDAKRHTVGGTYPLENRTPTGIAVGADSVWVAHGALGKLSAVDPEFGQVTKTIDVAGEALGSTNGSVAVGAGAVWAVYGDSTLAASIPTTSSSPAEPSPAPRRPESWSRAATCGSSTPTARPSSASSRRRSNRARSARRRVWLSARPRSPQAAEPSGWRTPAPTRSLGSSRVPPVLRRRRNRFESATLRLRWRSVADPCG